ncbi:MAG: hypothetical protein J6P19_02370, partial [Acetobacter sp.]|nr:hypothetical protein [Acetobacter sp.]
MRLRLRSFLLTSALTFAPAVASATTISGLYVDGGAGYNLVQDQHVHANVTPDGDAVQKFSVNHGTGFTGFGAVGWGFGNGLRVEAEGLYNFSHDNYTDNQMSLQDYYNLRGVNFYTALPGAKEVKCTGSGGFWEKGYNSESLWQSGSPTKTYLEDTTTASNAWDYIPANKCYLIQGTTINGTYYTAEQIMNTLYKSQEVQYNGYDQPPFAYTPNGMTHAINLDPGTYATTLNNLVDDDYQFAGNGNSLNKGHAVGMNVLKPIPLYTNHQGTDESYGGFFNVLYDFDLERLFGLKSIVTPFIGGGAGYLWQRYNRPGTNSLIPYVGAVANPMWGAITGTHGGFSWQGIAGVAFDTGISGLQITAQYRMIGQPGSFYNGSFNYGTDGGHANFDQRFNHQ